MCRVAVRNTARAWAQPDASGPAEDALMLQQLETLQPVKTELDLEELLEGEREINLDADLDFLAFFGEKETEGVNEAAAVLGQPVEMPIVPEALAALPTLPSLPTLPQANMEAMQYQAAMLQAAPFMAAPLQQQYTQAILQQQMMARMQAAGAAHTGTKRGSRSAQEIAEQQERIKRRRRESAQRSRQRKTGYMKTLECENQALRVENERLRKEVARMSGNPTQPPMFSQLTGCGSSADIKGAFESDNNVHAFYQNSYPTTAATSSDLGTPAAEELMCMVL